MWNLTKFDFFTAALTEFERVTAISGYTVVVGDGLADKSVGANYVFERHGLGNWVFTQKLSAPLEVNPMANDQFSWLTSISGNYMISSAFPTPLDWAGYAVIYKKQGSTWVEHEVLTPDDGPPANLQATQTETTKSKQSQMPGFPGNGFGICPSISRPLGSGWVRRALPEQGGCLLFRLGEGLGFQLECRIRFLTQTAHCRLRLQLPQTFATEQRRLSCFFLPFLA